jgi:site-specific DNA-methyltransferase (adenine-specific)
VIDQKAKPLFRVDRADAVHWLNGLDASSIDLMITDPPYESLEKHRSIGTTTRLKRSKASSNEWFPIFPNTRFKEFFDAAYRVMRRNTHLYLFCDPDTLLHAIPAGQAAGFRYWKPLVWNKLVLGMGYHYRRQYEFILFFEKGKRRLSDLSIPDVLAAKRVASGYPTEKPVELIRTLVRQSSERGETVCDPFCGSGSTGVAAGLEGRSHLGSDVADTAVALSLKRLQAAQSADLPLREALDSVPVTEFQTSN